MLPFILTAIVLAILPLWLWWTIFYQKNHVDKKLAIYTTLGGVLCVLPIWLYQYLFLKYPDFSVFGYIQNLSFSQQTTYLLIFIAVGAIEEVMKHWVIRVVDNKKKEWRSISDGIEFSVLAALGFSFLENIAYFVAIMQNEGYAALLIPFVFRSLFSTLAHTLFSGIYGYHFAIGKFSREWLIDHLGHGHKFYLTRFIYRFLKNPFINFLAQGVLAVSPFAVGYALYIGVQNFILIDPSESIIFKFALTIIFIGIGLMMLSMAWHGIRHMRRIQFATVFEEEERIEGLMLAIAAHTVFNFLLWMQWHFLIPVYLFAGYLYISWEFTKKMNLLDFETIEEKLQEAGVKE